MPDAELVARGRHVMTVCNACRYCEQYCPVFPAMEDRVRFAAADLAYLANLCHNCGECLFACQYAPPHEFGINVPRTLAEIRLRTYEDYCWPRFLGASFTRHGVATAVGLAAAMTVVMFAVTLVVNGGSLPRPEGSGDFYAVVPHHVLVPVFGAVFLFALAAMGIGVGRFWRDMPRLAATTARPSGVLPAIRDVLTLRHLHPSGADCTSAEETRTPWRRAFHQCTFYGFVLCFASTSVAAVYHTVFGWHAPYGYGSLPVLLGTVGGLALLVGPAGLLFERRRRDPELGDPAQQGLDRAFIVLLLLAAATGLVLLVLRERSVMSALLILHLGAVLALFLTLPYGKFVHGVYRAAALVRYERESAPLEGKGSS